MVASATKYVHMVISIILLAVSLACTGISCVVRLFDRLKLSILDAVAIQIALIIMVILPEIDYVGQILKVVSFTILLLVIIIYVIKVKGVQIAPLVLSCIVQIFCGFLGCYSAPIGGIAVAATAVVTTMVCKRVSDAVLCCLLPAAIWLLGCFIFDVGAFSLTVSVAVNAAVYALFAALPAVNLLRQNLRGENA